MARCLGAGVVFIRHTPEAIRVLKEWIASAAPGGYCAVAMAAQPRGINDQSCITILWKQVPEIRAAIQLLAPGQPGFNSTEGRDDKYAINSQVGQYITHYGALFS